VDTPAPSPRRAPSKAAVRALVESASKLDVEEILDLCFSFANDPLRLTVYLDVLRGKGGPKSQAAASLVCFDLARQGDNLAETEFLSLVPVMLDYTSQAADDDGRRPIDRLIGDNAYLRGLLTDLEKRLAALDPRLGAGSVDELVIEDAAVLEIDLLGSEDFEDIGFDDLEVLLDDAEAMEASWQAALDRFIGPLALAVAGPGESIGFTAETKAAMAHVERLRDEALSHQEHARGARSLLPLTELFLASHIRAKNLFGRRNKGRDHVLRSGLAHFTDLASPPGDMIAWLSSPTAVPHAWEKVAEILLDYIAFLGSLPPGSAPPQMPAEGFADAYLAAERPQPPPPRLLPEGSTRRRRR
jgi:hypothetical protein